METATEWSVRTWRERHDRGYFPKSPKHAGWRIYERFYAPFSHLIDDGDVCLEVGCGYGEWMHPVALKAGSGFVWGIDIHQGLISKAKELFRAHDIENANAKASDGVSVPFKDSVFDFVYSISVFQHIPKAMVRGYLKEIQRVLKTNGKAAFQFRNANNEGLPYPEPASDIEVNHSGDFSVGWSVDEVETACQTAGLLGDVMERAHSVLFLGKRGES